MGDNSGFFVYYLADIIMVITILKYCLSFCILFLLLFSQTSLARVIANNCRTYGSSKFVHLSAAACGVNEVKETIKIAHTDQKMFHKKTILFLDEIHRFNKSQQVRHNM